MGEQDDYCYLTVAQDRKSGGPYQICYRIVGNGSKRILSVSGLGESMGICIENAKNLAKSGEFTICALANRGAPYTSQVPRGYTIKDMALDALELLYHLRWFEGVNVIGVSMGGMISLELALLAPVGIIDRLVLVVTTAGQGVITPTAFLAFIPDVFNLGVATTQHQAENFVLNSLFTKGWRLSETSKGEFYTNEEALRRNFQKWIGEKGNVQTVPGRAGQLFAINNHLVNGHRLKNIAKLNIKPFVIVPDHDKLVGVSDGIELASDIGCPLIKFKHVGHGLVVERPRLFEKTIREIMSDNYAGLMKNIPNLRTVENIKGISH